MKKLLVKQRISKFYVLRFSLSRSSEFSSSNATCLSCHKSCGECYGPGSNHCLTCLPNHSLASGRHHIWFIIFIIRFSFKTRIIKLTTITGSCLSTCPPGQHKVCTVNVHSAKLCFAIPLLWHSIVIILPPTPSYPLLNLFSHILISQVAGSASCIDCHSSCATCSGPGMSYFCKIENQPNSHVQDLVCPQFSAINNQIIIICPNSGPGGCTSCSSSAQLRDGFCSTCEDG